MRNSILISLFLLVSHLAFAGSVDFIIAGVHKPVHKWGHATLSVTEGNKTRVYDFGRYARMWKVDIEGDPVLRVWRDQKLAIHDVKKAGGKVSVVHFEADSKQTEAIFNYFDNYISAAEKIGKNKNYESYILSGQPYHAIVRNCTTMAIEGFQQGFPSLDVDDKRFLKLRGLQTSLKLAAKTFGKRTTHIWWPADLLALLEENFVKTDEATETIY